MTRRFFWLALLALLLVGGAERLVSSTETPAPGSLRETVVHYDHADRLLDEIR